VRWGDAAESGNSVSMCNRDISPLEGRKPRLSWPPEGMNLATGSSQIPNRTPCRHRLDIALLNKLLHNQRELGVVN